MCSGSPFRSGPDVGQHFNSDILLWRRRDSSWLIVMKGLGHYVFRLAGNIFEQLALV